MGGRRRTSHGDDVPGGTSCDEEAADEAGEGVGDEGVSGHCAEVKFLGAK